MKLLAILTVASLGLITSSVFANPLDEFEDTRIIPGDRFVKFASYYDRSRYSRMRYSRNQRYKRQRYRRASSRHRSRRSSSDFPRRINPPGERVFIFSPRLRAWAAYMPDGSRAGYGRANGGAHWCADAGRSCRTPRGAFRIRSKGSPGCKSGKYPRPNGGAPMPYCMFFKSAYAIHGSPYISNNNTSHGCIRVKTDAARWLSQRFMNIGTRVVVTSY